MAEKKQISREVDVTLDIDTQRYFTLDDNLSYANPRVKNSSVKIQATKNANVHLIDLNIVFELKGVKRPPDPGVKKITKRSGKKSK